MAPSANTQYVLLAEVVELDGLSTKPVSLASRFPADVVRRIGAVLDPPGAVRRLRALADLGTLRVALGSRPARRRPGGGCAGRSTACRPSCGRRGRRRCRTVETRSANGRSSRTLRSDSTLPSAASRSSTPSSARHRVRRRGSAVFTFGSCDELVADTSSSRARSRASHRRPGGTVAGTSWCARW